MTSAIVSDLLHLRRPKTRENLNSRSRIRSAARRELEELGFLEVDTPALGDRVDEYPAGHFCVLQADGPDLWLVQSPQVFKQALIASGIQRYFQFAHCFRDNDREPGRTDYLREFVLLDVEMCADSVGEVMEVAEAVVRSMYGALGMELPPSPFPRIDFADTIEQYGTDRPDLRQRPGDMSCIWVTDFPLARPGDAGSVVMERHPMALPHVLPGSKEEMLETRTHSYDLVVNGYEVASGDLRIHDPVWQKGVLETAGIDPKMMGGLFDVLEACPPHGGFGLGLDRICMQLLRADSIGEVSAFPDGFGE